MVGDTKLLYEVMYNIQARTYTSKSVPSLSAACLFSLSFSTMCFLYLYIFSSYFTGMFSYTIKIYHCIHFIVFTTSIIPKKMYRAILTLPAGLDNLPLSFVTTALQFIIQQTFASKMF